MLQSATKSSVTNLSLLVDYPLKSFHRALSRFRLPSIQTPTNWLTAHKVITTTETN